jgi:hypothetical protein
VTDGGTDTGRASNETLMVSNGNSQEALSR